MPGDIDAGDFMPVPLQKGQHVFFRLEFRNGQGGVDIDFMGGGNLVQHELQSLQVGKRLAAGKDKVAVRSNRVHTADAGTDFLSGEPGQVGVLTFIDAEGAVILTVVGHEDCHRGAAFPRLVGMLHSSSPFVYRVKRYLSLDFCGIPLQYTHNASILTDFLRQVKSNSEKRVENQTKSARFSGQSYQSCRVILKYLF